METLAKIFLMNGCAILNGGASKNLLVSFYAFHNKREAYQRETGWSATPLPLKLILGNIFHFCFSCCFSAMFFTDWIFELSRAIFFMPTLHGCLLACSSEPKLLFGIFIFHLEVTSRVKILAPVQFFMIAKKLLLDNLSAIFETRLPHDQYC